MYQKREHASRAFDRRFLYDATSEKRHVTSEIANLSDRRISIGNANNMFRAQPGSIKNSFEEFAPISEVSARVMKKSCTQVECVSMLETVQHEKGYEWCSFAAEGRNYETHLFTALRVIPRSRFGGAS
ncbi:unnamed protein product [Oikopleura dioica]|uniref:Uncharacterized protein n=1 Tax=Oikopleura dioica TaxID=34765 RepID=E4XRI2_OIKDI|nr:unnamed protein product [Oikopleura dioica]